MEEKVETGLTRSELNKFLADLTTPNEGPIAWIEVAPKVVEHFHSPQDAKAIIEGPGYFLYQNVKCYVEGMKDKADKKDGLTMEEVVFGKKA